MGHFILRKIVKFDTMEEADRACCKLIAERKRHYFVVGDYEFDDAGGLIDIHGYTVFERIAV